jgi:hypothetical protein
MADMLRFEITQTPDFAAFARVLKAKQQPFFAAAMEIAVNEIVEGIAASRSITGGSFPALARSTVLRKLHDKPLVDKGLLSDAFTYEQINKWRKGEGIITVKPLTAPTQAARKTKSGRWTTRAKKGAARDTPRDKVAFYLQVEGLKNGKKFVFFGISENARSRIDALVSEVVADALAAVTSK